MSKHLPMDQTTEVVAAPPAEAKDSQHSSGDQAIAAGRHSERMLTFASVRIAFDTCLVVIDYR